jgi:hypothetical protein
MSSDMAGVLQLAGDLVGAFLDAVADLAEHGPVASLEADDIPAAC